MEERHLHHGVDARAEPAFARQLGGVDDIETRLALVQQRLNLLRQARPDLVGAVRGIEQEGATGLQAFDHLVLIDKLQLVAADEVRAADQVGRVDRLLADAQVRHRQAAGLLES